MNSFYDFKAFLKRLKNNKILEKEKCAVELEKIRNKNLGISNNILDTFYFLNIVELLKTLFPNRFDKRVQQMADLNASSSKYAKIDDEILEINYLLNAFDDTSFFKEIQDYTYFLYLLNLAIKENVIMVETACIIFGRAVCFNLKKKNQISSNKKGDILSKIASFYKDSGEFIKSSEKESLKKLIISLIDFEKNHQRILINANEERNVLESLASAFDRLYNTFLNSYHEPIEKTSDEVPKVDYTYMSILRKYYRNGKIVKIPEDMIEFENILEQCNIDINEKKYILFLIQEFKMSSLPKCTSVAAPLPAANTQDSREIYELFYATNNPNDVSKCYFVNDLLALPVEYLKDILILINSFKEGRARKIKTLGCGANYIRIKRNQVRIILKHLNNNCYSVVGILIKKNTDIRIYDEFVNRFVSEPDKNYALEVEEFYKQYIDEKGRKGNKLQRRRKNANIS